MLFGHDSTYLKRPAYKLELPIDGNSFYEANIKSTPYVLPNRAIPLYPGERVYVVVDQIDGNIKKLHAVSEIQDSSKTLIISLYLSPRRTISLRTINITCFRSSHSSAQGSSDRLDGHRSMISVTIE
jgi:hypothetical protein